MTLPLPNATSLPPDCILIASAAYLPILTRLSLNTSNMGKPAIVLTLIKLPLKLSVMLNNEPLLPVIDKLPDASTVNLMLAFALPLN